LVRREWLFEVLSEARGRRRRWLVAIRGHRDHQNGLPQLTAEILNVGQQFKAAATGHRVIDRRISARSSTKTILMFTRDRGFTAMSCNSRLYLISV
jgi:hypothetical protein